MEEILKAEGVSYDYQDSIAALSDITMGVLEGERFALIGANGSGKSTLLKVLSGLIPPRSGKVFFRGGEINRKSLGDRDFLRTFRGSVGYIFQDPEVQLFCPTVLDELLFGPLQLGISEEESMERAEEIMKMLKITGIRNRPSYMLSGGEKKRVAIGSVLTMNPGVLLLDEPTGGLDPRTQCFLFELMYTLNESGKTIVISTHDLSLVDEFQPRVAVLSEDHRIEKTGRADEILDDEDLLLRVNLIHEHIHYHGETAHTHRHSHYVYHKHR